MRVLSLGAGVQSSTLLLMACQGDLALDAAIFADTQREPQAVYRHLAWIIEQASRAGIPVYQGTRGNLRDDALSTTRRAASMPLHLRNRDGSKGLLNRQCTEEYKLKVIRAKLRELGATARHPFTQVIGISLDEAIRMNTSKRRYVVHEYPLVDRGITRHDCTLWLQRHGYPIPPKSACIECPYHGDAFWRTLKAESPEEFAEAVAFDAAIRHNPRTRISGEAFLHRKLIPLDQVDLRSVQERGQLDLFGEECAGVCGV